MATKHECCLCNPGTGTDCVCDQCKDKAAGYDLIHSNLTLAGLTLRRLRQMILLDMPILDNQGVADKGSFYIDRIDSLLVAEFARVLAEYDLRKAKEAEFQRQADAACLHKDEPTERAA